MSPGACSKIINSIIFQEAIVQQVKPGGEDTVGGHDKKVNKGFHFPTEWGIVTTRVLDWEQEIKRKTSHFSTVKLRFINV